jgi:pimeloyl-ACP methyl ester carboxylesterase
MPAIAQSILSSAPPRFALAGLSMGGYIAFEIMRRAPERVARLALLDTSARPDTPEQTQRRRLMISAVQKGEFNSVIDTLFPLYVHPSRRNDQGLRAVVNLMGADTGPEGFIRQQTAVMARPDSRPGLSAIKCPALVLAGDSDAVTPPELAKEIAGGIPGAQLVIVQDCGHLSTIERPDYVNARLADWLKH